MQRIGAERGANLSTPSDRGPVASGARYVNKLSVTHVILCHKILCRRVRDLDTFHAVRFVTEQMRTGMCDGAQSVQYAQYLTSAESVYSCMMWQSGHWAYKTQPYEVCACSAWHDLVEHVVITKAPICTAVHASAHVQSSRRLHQQPCLSGFCSYQWLNCQLCTLPYSVKHGWSIVLLWSAAVLLWVGAGGVQPQAGPV